MVANHRRDEVENAEITLILNWLAIAKSPPPRIDLNETERNIVEAIGDSVLRGDKIAKLAGYPFNSNFKTTLSSLKKRGILDNKGRGYFVIRLSGQLSGQGQD
jgi:hypothetical protein